MTTARLIRWVLLFVFATAPAAAQSRVRIPTAPAAPVLLDGQFSPGEWESTEAIPLGESIRMLAKQMAGDVFLGFHTATRLPRPVDIYLQDETGEIHQLHASAQIGERRLPAAGWSDTVPEWRWGNHRDWMANEAKVDSRQPREVPFSLRAFPADGVEFQIRRARFPGSRWRMRVDVGAFPGNQGEYRFPVGATDDPATWAVVDLP